MDGKYWNSCCWLSDEKQDYSEKSMQSPQSEYPLEVVVLFVGNKCLPPKHLSTPAAVLLHENYFKMPHRQAHVMMWLGSIPLYKKNWTSPPRGPDSWSWIPKGEKDNYYGLKTDGR